MKYDDWRGVMTARDLAIEGSVTEDADLKAVLDAYQADARERSYHMGGNW